MAYHAFKDPETGDTFGSFETFEIRSGDDDMRDEEGEPLAPGIYWWACFPGCMPDGDPSGPFKTEEQAIDDANS